MRRAWWGSVAKAREILADPFGEQTADPGGVPGVIAWALAPRPWDVPPTPDEDELRRLSSARTRRDAAGILRDLDLEQEAALPLAELIVRAYKAGERACTARLTAPDTADALARAIEDPKSVLEQQHCGETQASWTTRAVRHVIAERGVSV